MIGLLFIPSPGHTAHTSNASRYRMILHKLAPVESAQPWSSLVKEMNNWIGLTVKHEWNYAIHVLHYFLGLSKTQQLTAWAETAFISYY